MWQGQLSCHPELPGEGEVQKVLMGRACPLPLQSILCKNVLCLCLVSQLAGLMGSLLMTELGCGISVSMLGAGETSWNWGLGN